MDTKINVQGKVCTGNVLQPRCYKSYTDIASLSAVKLKQLCVQYNLDTTLPKKAKIVFLCQRLGISTTGNNLNVQKSKKSARTFDSLTSYQHEELEQLRSKILHGMPSSEWTTDISKVPEINDVSVKHYLLETNILDKSSSRTYKLSRPYQLRSSVHSVKYCENVASDTFGILSARCNSSQSANPDEVKVLYIVIDKITGDPYSGFCTCTVGFSETCGHVGAALFLVAEQMANGMSQFNNTDSTSCTDKLCSWTEPKGSQVEPDIFENFKIKKNAEKQQMRRTIDDFGKKVLASEPPTYDAVAKLHADLINATHHMGQYCPAVHVLNPKRYKKDTQEVSSYHTAVHLDDYISESSPLLAYSSETEIHSTPLPVTRIEHKTFQSASEPSFKREIECFTKKAATHTCDRAEIDEITVGQSSNPEWREQRKGCITATKFYSVIKTVEKEKENTTLVNEILNKNNKDFLSKVPSIKWGRTNEIKGKKMYLQKVSKYHTKLKIEEHGLMVSKELNFVRGSPDGIVTCRCHSSMSRLLEIKCPYSAKDMTIEEAIIKKKIKYLEKKDNILQLKKNSQDGYYAQIQGLLGITGLKLANLVVWTTKDCKIVTIKYEEEFYKKKLIPACESFFRTLIAPALLLSQEASDNYANCEDDIQNVVLEDKTSKDKSNDQAKIVVTKSVETECVIPVQIYRCYQCCKILPEDGNINEDNSNASVGCDCPNCACDVWMCWPCARYTEEWKLENVDWFCPHCTRECDLVY